MTIFWINLTVVFFFSFLARYYAVPSKNINAVIPKKPNKLLIFVAFVSLTLVSGLRANIGDTYFYIHSFETNYFTWESVLADKDIGFGLLQFILKNYVSEDPQILIFITALLTNLLLVIVFYHYSRMIEISLYVYITGGLFLVSMNGIRQVLAAAIAFTAIRFLIKGNFIAYTFIIIVASLFHQSALVLIPIYFLVRYKAWSKATVALIIFSVIIVLGYEQFSNLLFTAIEDTQYGHYESFAEGGANTLRVLVAAVPLVIAYLGREKLRRIFPSSDYIVNMALVGLIFMIISTQNWIFARFSIYFEIYTLILLSWIIQLFTESNRKLIYYGIIVCYLAYYYYENVMTLNIMYRSNYFM
ncbi:EpsG family protein [Virgibacillus sp. W0181]|uniref:EpsG family protein n=1 Tax=Virgibacillus sp. W0181 TaxID=3391581 RepID=UPI003F488CAF